MVVSCSKMNNKNKKK